MYKKTAIASIVAIISLLLFAWFGPRLQEDAAIFWSFLFIISAAMLVFSSVLGLVDYFGRR